MCCKNSCNFYFQIVILSFLVVCDAKTLKTEKSAVKDKPMDVEREALILRVWCVHCRHPDEALRAATSPRVPVFKLEINYSLSSSGRTCPVRDRLSEEALFDWTQHHHEKRPGRQILGIGSICLFLLNLSQQRKTITTVLPRRLSG